MNEYGQLRLLAREIPRGQQSNGLLCPFCNGGKHGEKALSLCVRRDGTALFICHRASCSRAGRINFNGNVSWNVEMERGPEFHPRNYGGATKAISKEEQAILEHNYQLTFREVNWHRLSIDTESGRLVIPINNPKGQIRGFQLCNLPGATTAPKAISYKERDEPFVGWFWTETSNDKRIVVVEDCISAMRVARRNVACALLGTNIPVDFLFEMLRFTDHIVLALDKDATQRALEYQRKFKFLAPQMQVAILDKDLKWESDEEIKKRVEI